MDTIQHGIIGLGFFGELHLETLHAMQGVNVSALSTRTQQRLTELGETYSVPGLYTDYKELLANPDIDSVSIVSHVDKHEEMAIAALEAGKHVFLEKPMAENVEQCQAILEAAQSAPGKLMVGHICRFDPRIAMAKDAIDAGRIGEVVSMYARRNLPADIAAGVLDKISPLAGDGIHDVDLMLWLTGKKITTAYARNIRVRDFKHPDIAWAMYTFENDAVGVVETAWFLPENTPYKIDARMEIIGTKGALYIDCGDAGLTINDGDGISKPDTHYWPFVHGKRGGALKTELEYFLDCVRGDTDPDIVPPAESLEAVKVVCAAEQSTDSGQPVTV